MTIQGANAAKNAEVTVIKGKNRIENASENALETVKKATSEKENVQKGGQYIPCNKINQKIKRGGARLRKTMKMFSTTLGKLKYKPPGSKTKRRKR